MSRITSVFSMPGYGALVAYLTAGYPTPEATSEAASILANNGCDIIELGIPFSDPLADGVTIQKASYQALKQGITPQACLEVAASLRRRVPSTPIVFMSYYNPIFSFGLESFCHASVKAGIDGLIIPDLPPEEGAELETVTKRHGIDLIYLLAPTSTEERIKLVAGRSRGFIYLVSVSGVTGAREQLPSGLSSFIARVRKIASQPLCVGFGISTAGQVRQLATMVDGVIVGSRLIQLIDEDATLASLAAFTSSLREALNQRKK